MLQNRFLIPSLPTTCVAFAVAALGLLSSSTASQAAGIHGFPGISLARLVDGGGEFESRNGKLTFSGFEAQVNGFALQNLDFYRLFPVGNGFRIITPLAAFLGSSAELELRYEVTAEDGLLIDGTRLSFLGFAVGKNASAFAKETIFDGDTSVADLEVSRRGFLGRDAKDRALIDPALASFNVEELIGASSSFFDFPGRPLWNNGHNGWQNWGDWHKGFDWKQSEPGDHAGMKPRKDGEHGHWNQGKHGFGGFALTLAVDHRYRLVSVPEPSTALLVSLGMVGMAAQRRSRRNG